MYNAQTPEAQPAVDYTALSHEDLIHACLQPGNELAWAEFIRRFQSLIARVIVRVACQWGEISPQVVDDLVQETYLKFCAERFRALLNFKSIHKDAIYGYVKVFTANLAHDHFKAAHSQKRGGRAPAVSMEEGEDPNGPGLLRGSSAAVMDRNVLLQEVDACLKAVSTGPGCDRDRRIFWLYYKAGLTASAIAALPTVGLSTKGVESTILRLTKQVRQRLVATKQQAGSQA